MMRRVLLATYVRWSALSVPLLTVALCPRSAFAQDKKELSKARAQFQRAIELEQAGNYTQALESFRDVGQEAQADQLGMHRDPPPRPTRFHPPPFVVAVDEEVGDPLLLPNIGNLQPPEFLQPSAREERKQRNPLRGLPASTGGAMALTEHRR